MDFLAQVHSNFLKDVGKYVMFEETRLAILPTLWVMISSFVLLYQNLELARVPWSTKLARFGAFQVTLFGISRIWLFVLKWLRIIRVHLDVLLPLYSGEQTLRTNQMLVHLCICILACIIAIFPFATITYLFKRYEHQLLLLRWFHEDPWENTEIGTSGHYLLRPPMRLPRVTQRHRFRRTASVHNLSDLEVRPLGLRRCASDHRIHRNSHSLLI